MKPCRPILPVFCWGLCLAFLADVGPLAAQGSSACRPIRRYTFEQTTPERPEAANELSDQTPMRLGGEEPLEVVAGHLPNSRAVRLDKDWFQADPFSVETDPGVTIEMWVRKLGPGSLLGNGSPNGMFFAMGDGYWSGLRCYADHPSSRPLFQIGRPQPSSAVTAPSEQPILEGVWTHLVCTWDGQVMRIYLNGIPAGSTPFEGPVPPASGPLRVGYANAGIGSNRMDVDELTVYQGAMPPIDVLRRSCDEAPLSDQAAQRFETVFETMTGDDSTVCLAKLNELIEDDSLAGIYRGRARLLLGQLLGKNGDSAGAVRRFVEIFNDTTLPDSLRQEAVRLCMIPEGGAVRVNLPSEVYARMLAQENLSDEKQLSLQMQLAEALYREGQDSAGAELLLTVLYSGKLSEKDKTDVFSRLREMAMMGRMPAEQSKIIQQLGQNDPALRKPFPGAAPMQLIDMADTIAPWTEPAPTIRPLGQPTFFVGPAGDDTNPGTREKPLATLQGARDAVRRLMTEGKLPENGAVVAVLPGVYRVEETLQLDQQDNDLAIVAASNGDRPVFTGGVELSGFQTVADPDVLERLPEAARGHVVRCDLKARGIENLGSLNVRGMGGADYPVRPWVDLYVNHRPMTLARWPNVGEPELTVGEVFGGAFQTADANKAGEFAFADSRLDRWTAAEDPWMEGKWGHLWAARTVPVTRIDREKGRIETGPGSGYGFRAGQPFHFINLLEEIDTPGEWYLNRQTGIVYLWPPDDFTGSVESLRAELPLLEKPMIEIRGARGVLLCGLTLQSSRADALGLFDCEDCTIVGCTMQRLGGNAVCVRGGKKVDIVSCDMLQLGAGGVTLSGGDRNTLTAGNHRLWNCHIGDFSRVDRSYAPAVTLIGVGQTVMHNLIHGSPHHALRIEGDLHRVALNEVHSVVYEYDDQAGIDMWGDPTCRGNVFSYNYWHHIGSGLDVAGQSGIRLDDAISDVLILGNTFYKASAGRFGGVQIHGGKDNVVMSNLFLDCRYALSFSPWGEQRWRQSLENPHFKQKIDASLASEKRLVMFPDLKEIASHADRNFIIMNVSIGCGRHALRERGVNLYMGNSMYDGDWRSLGLTDPDTGPPRATDATPRELQTRLKKISGAAPLIGPYQDEYRPTWPIQHRVSSQFKLK